MHVHLTMCILLYDVYCRLRVRTVWHRGRLCATNERKNTRPHVRRPVFVTVAAGERSNVEHTMAVLVAEARAYMPYPGFTLLCTNDGRGDVRKTSPLSSCWCSSRDRTFCPSVVVVIFVKPIFLPTTSAVHPVSVLIHLIRDTNYVVRLRG